LRWIVQALQHGGAFSCPAVKRQPIASPFEEWGASKLAVSLDWPCWAVGLGGAGHAVNHLRPGRSEGHPGGRESLRPWLSKQTEMGNNATKDLHDVHAVVDEVTDLQLSTDRALSPRCRQKRTWSGCRAVRDMLSLPRHSHARFLVQAEVAASGCRGYWQE